MSIRLRLTLWYVGILALVLVVFALGLYSLASYALTREIDGYLQERGLEVQAQLEGVLLLRGGSASFPAFPGVVELAPLDVFATPHVYIQVLDIAGGDVQVALTSGSLGTESLPASPEVLEGVKEGRSVLKTLPVGTTPIRILSLPVRSGGQVVGVVQVGRSLAEIEATLRNLALLLAGGIALALVAAAGGGALLARQALRPVHQMTQVALTITRTRDLGRRLQGARPSDELARLAAAFNEMLDRLEELFLRQRRFTADISHELRTPLTVLRGNLDLLRRGGMESGEALRTMEAEVGRMALLVDDLLLLAQFDEGVELEHRPVELDALLWEVYHHARARGTQGVEVSLVHEDQVVVLGDRERLRQMLVNLVDNALKYTLPAGKVFLSLYLEGDWVRLAIADTGIGIPPEDLPHLFERFYRVDRARSRERGGTGLGLSIVKRIAEAHEGRVDVESCPGQGSTFTVWLPLLAPKAAASPERGAL